VAPWRQFPRIEMQPVCDLASRRAFCEIGAVCFHVPLLWFEEVFDERMAERSEFVAWLAFLNGEPVATAATVVAADVVGVYNVGTPPAHRGKGIGEAIVRYAIDRASEKTGIRRTVLQSTSFGYELYRQMGYHKVGRVLVFTS